MSGLCGAGHETQAFKYVLGMYVANCVCVCVFCLFVCFETWSQCLAKADLELPESVGVTDTYWPPHPTFFFESCPILWVRIPPSDLIYFRLFFEAWFSDTVTLSERDSTYEFEVKGRHKSIYKDPTVTSKSSRVMMATQRLGLETSR